MAFQTARQIKAHFKDASWGDSPISAPPAGVAEPDRILVMYLGFDQDFQLKPVQRAELLNGRTVEVAEEEIVAQIRVDLASGTPLPAEGAGVQFDHYPSYFTVVLDAGKWQFFPENGGAADETMIFVREKAADSNGPGTRYDPNKSFYNLSRRRIQGRDSIRCANYMLDRQGRPMQENETRTYSFNFLVRVPINNPESGEDPWLTIIIDPTGQNQGPKRP
ncbi:hypothetical protein [Flavisphingomonas formosensis]|uniref:hypothetical protein n=1 Tax=Flavisphingomonas formosensis TaxID=861534 RepID=UPI0012FBAFAA|nr:hypothetical protein [Sphingomonas formosensis]